MPRYQLLLRCENVPISTRRPCHSTYGTYMTVVDKTSNTLLGQTETVSNTPHPEYCKSLFLETDASVYHPLLLTIYQDNGIGRDSPALWESQTIEATEVIQSKGHEQVINMSNSGKGKMIVRMVETIQSTSTITMQFRALDLHNVEPGWFGLGRSDPYLEISKKSVDPAAGWVRWHVVYRSEIICNHLNPYWEAFTMTVEELCWNVTTGLIRIRVMDDNGTQKPPTLIGQVLESTVAQLQSQLSQRGNADRSRALPLFRENDTIKCRGWLVVLQADVDESSSS